MAEQTLNRQSISNITGMVKGIRVKTNLIPYLFLLPALVIYLTFNLGLVLATVVLSFFK